MINRFKFPEFHVKKSIPMILYSSHLILKNLRN